jgi:hypothetical protein
VDSELQFSHLWQPNSLALVQCLQQHPKTSFLQAWRQYIVFAFTCKISAGDRTNAYDERTLYPCFLLSCSTSRPRLPVVVPRFITSRTLLRREAHAPKQTRRDPKQAGRAPDARVLLSPLRFIAVADDVLSLMGLLSSLSQRQ